MRAFVHLHSTSQVDELQKQFVEGGRTQQQLEEMEHALEQARRQEQAAFVELLQKQAAKAT